MTLVQHPSIELANIGCGKRNASLPRSDQPLIRLSHAIEAVGQGRCGVGCRGIRKNGRSLALRASPFAIRLHKFAFHGSLVTKPRKHIHLTGEQAPSDNMDKPETVRARPKVG